MSQREIRIYKYRFSNGSVIEIEAENRAIARDFLRNLVYSKPEDYLFVILESETVTKPLQDVTKKVVNGKTYVWIGFEASPESGWMEYNYYKWLRKLVPIKGRKIK